MRTYSPDLNSFTWIQLHTKLTVHECNTNLNFIKTQIYTSLICVLALSALASGATSLAPPTELSGTVNLAPPPDSQEPPSAPIQLRSLMLYTYPQPSRAIQLVTPPRLWSFEFDHNPFGPSGALHISPHPSQKICKHMAVML